jgi:PAS domain S-box-containing protein
MGEDRTRLLEQMFQASPDALIVVGPDGLIEVAGPSTDTIFGYRPEELEGRPLDVLLPEGSRSVHRGHVAMYAKAPGVRPMGLGRELYGRHKNGSVFPIDVSLVPTVVDGRPRFGAFVRDARERRMREDVLRFVNEISRVVIAGEPTADLLARTARAARSLVGAVASWVSVRAGDQMLVAAAEGESSSVLEGATVPVEISLAAKVVQSNEIAVIDDMAADPNVLLEARAAGFGPGLYIPMHAEDGPIGALVLARSHGEDRFNAAERSAAQVFASAAAIVLALGSARSAVDRMRIAAEHERIARDLHDTVIQRLFGLGMRLQAAERMAEGTVAERIRDTVDAIDEVIREIRETIFDLNRPDGTEVSTLRSRFRDVIGEAAETLGFRPRVAFRGPVDSAVPDELLVHLIAVLRESLSNVSRHAKATAVDVVVSVSEGVVSLNVGDDGVGFPGHPAAGHGLANMTARATELGGRCAITRRHPSGTLVQWEVPLQPTQ